jgi:hypothetical protein
MYHSPGLRDGVSSQGMCVRPCPPDLLGADSAIAHFSFAGNKLGRSQVIMVNWNFQQTLLDRERAGPASALFEFPGASCFWNLLNHLLQPAV